VARFADAEGITIVVEFTEIESGKAAAALEPTPQSPAREAR
jgi:hypothetical protein